MKHELCPKCKKQERLKKIMRLIADCELEERYHIVNEVLMLQSFTIFDAEHKSLKTIVSCHMYEDTIQFNVE